MTIGILTAMPEERAYFGDHLSIDRTLQVAGTRFDQGALDGRPVVLVECGIGKVNAALATTLLIERFACSGLVFSGVAGGVDPSLSVGDLVVADSVLQHDYGACRDGVVAAYRPGALPIQPPNIPAAIEAEPALVARARTALAGLDRIRFGRVLTGDSYLACAVTRDRLFASYGGIAIDMESGAVAQVAEAYRVPWLIVRALSDLAGEDSHLDFHAFLDRAATRAAEAVRRLVPIFERETVI